MLRLYGRTGLRFGRLGVPVMERNDCNYCDSSNDSDQDSDKCAIHLVPSLEMLWVMPFNGWPRAL